MAKSGYQIGPAPQRSYLPRHRKVHLSWMSSGEVSAETELDRAGWVAV